MKHSTFLASAFAALFLVSCSPKMPYMASTNYVDYKAYTEQGIFLTESNSVSFDYTPLGSVSVTVLSGNVVDLRRSKYAHQDLNGERDDMEKYNKWKSADVNDAIAMAVEKVKEMNGNGLINLQVQPITEIVNKVTRSGYLVTGMAIKK